MEFAEVIIKICDQICRKGLIHVHVKSHFLLSLIGYINRVVIYVHIMARN